MIYLIRVYGIISGYTTLTRSVLNGIESSYLFDYMKGKGEIQSLIIANLDTLMMRRSVSRLPFLILDCISRNYPILIFISCGL